MYWNLTVILLSTLLLAFLLWKEVRRPVRAALAARIIASVMAVFCLACIAIPLSFSRQLKSQDSSVAIFLTKGYNKDSVEKIIRSVKDARVFSIDKNIKAFGSRYVADIGPFSKDSLQSAQVHIFGFGLDQHDLASLNKANITFHPGDIDNQITSISWTKQITSGEPCIVQGKFKNTKAASVKILLSGFDTNLDSVIAAPGQLTSFQLTAIPKHIGKAVFAVSVLASTDTLESNPLPLEVIMPVSVKVLLLAAFPDFENKFLKNWLAQNEYSFAVRTRISKNKFDKQYINISPVGLDRITPGLLEKFDVVIADLAELKSLPVSDLGALRSFIESKGAGLVVKAGNAERSSAFYLRSFPLVESRDSLRHTSRLRIGGTDITATLRIEQPMYIQFVPGTRSLIKDQQQRIVASGKLLGVGNTIITTIPNSYTWWLGGNTDAYASYWTFLLKNAAKKNVLTSSWRTDIALPQVNEEMQIKLQSESATLSPLQASEVRMQPEQNYLLPFEWAMRYWPSKPGWQTLMRNDTVSTSLYVYESVDWRGVQAADMIAQTMKYAGGGVGLSEKTSDATVDIPVPKIYFLLVFLLFSGFLWFEKKYRSGDVN